ncbi:MAG TPA: MASE1 domain-containing protein, partial [Gammaproteobacteria bacterium]|nr:MASE1 domain-containing protein [Gammaproteobacteria bacterium]
MALLVANIISALAYVFAGYLGLLLALPPSNASPIWPAAGVALAAVLLKGPRVLPGLLVGAFCSQFISYVDTTTTKAIIFSLYIALGTALGSVLQAWLGAVLIERFVGRNDSLTRDSQIIRFLGLGGPVSCLCSASVGVSILLLGNVIHPGEALLTWGTWWVGDSIGVLIVTPVLFILL